MRTTLAYANAGVKEVWLVLAPEKQIEVHRKPSGGQFAERVVSGPGGQLVSIAVPSFNVGLEVLFAKQGFARASGVAGPNSGLP